MTGWSVPGSAWWWRDDLAPTAAAAAAQRSFTRQLTLAAEDAAARRRGPRRVLAAVETNSDVAKTVLDFWRLVDSSGGVHACHPWKGYVSKGYGLFTFFGMEIRAHELAVLFATGEIRPAGWDTCHSCHNTLCCNPTHLRYVRRQDDR